MESINSTLGNIAAATEEIYNNGRSVSSDEKLVYQDFLQLCFIQWGDIAAIQYYNELRVGNQDYFFSQSIVTKTVKVKEGSNGRGPYFILADYALLPYMAGILALYPVTKESYRDPDYDFLKMRPGSDSLYGKPKIMDDLGLRFFIAKGDRIELFGDDRISDLNVEYMPLSEDTIVPSRIGKIIINEILKVVLPGKGAPIDTHEDTDPNQTTYKQRLDEPQGIS